ncbi:MAG: LysR family transcriptional regulator [Alphaproteobacteria bacterium]|nr:LysR family transcriptional regulator [Alphaproteobacteria bacterium]
MPIVLAIARTGSVEGAAKTLSIDRTTVGRRLKALEHLLGARLFDRLQGRYQVTALGREVLGAAEAAEQDLVSVQSLVPDERTGSQQAPLLITTAPHLMPVLAPAIMDLHEARNIKIELKASYSLADMEAREADIALRLMKKGPDFPLVGRKLKDLRGAMFRPKHHNRKSLPYIERDFDTGIPDFAQPWIGDMPNLRSSSTGSLVELIAAGGIGRLPLFVGDNDPRLERASDILPDEGWQLWLVSHDAFSRSPRIKDAIDILARRIMSMKNI